MKLPTSSSSSSAALAAARAYTSGARLSSSLGSSKALLPRFASTHSSSTTSAAASPTPASLASPSTSRVASSLRSIATNALSSSSTSSTSSRCPSTAANGIIDAARQSQLSCQSQLAARALSTSQHVAARRIAPSSRSTNNNTTTTTTTTTTNTASSTDASSNYSTPLPASSLVNVTTLPNKVRVATEATPGHFSAVGVYIDAGSRFERPWVPGESGCSHLLDRLAFKSTRNRSAEQMTSEIEALGGNVMCSSSRETIMYQSSVFNNDVPAVLSILADTILNPLLSPAELDMQREAAAYEIQEIWSKPEMILPELLHTTAYSANTLGNPLLCPIESLEQMTADNLRAFINTWYTPDRIVVAGSGMPHDQLVELSQQLFGHLSAASASASASSSSSSASVTSSSSASSSSSSSSSSRSSSPSSIFSRSSSNFSTSSSSSASSMSPSVTELANARAQYTGGELYIPQSDLEFTHVYVAFEGLSIHDDDIYALATLQILLGGGGSFSAGGPGKGMYSRLYTNVLNQHHAVDYCAAFHHCYSDSGLFGVSASVHPSFNASIAHVIARELELCTAAIYQGSVTQVELNRAKNQLKSSLVMALESRLVEVEDLGRQIQAHGRKIDVAHMCDRIDAVDLATLHRVATRVLRPQTAKVAVASSSNSAASASSSTSRTTATVVAQGNLDGLGDVRALLAKRGLGSAPNSN
ncbi:hypothetical protein BCV70DRAFT_198661 [Testicularia cyperi]|uniref:Mitochondrial-processing peptidase subunit alpha n=1 Tax=Testicularia cyperi TaxID=1882483 RepID=A0A317XWA4_9BASI|nr:hypothetical protein BCV70DRAFT_198661 [Testicularia cyperi]